MAPAVGGAPEGRAPHRSFCARLDRLPLGLAPFAGFLVVFLVWPTVGVVVSAIQPVRDGVRPALLEAVSGQYLGTILQSARLSAITAVLGAVIGALVAAATVAIGRDGWVRSAVTGYSAVAANLGGIPLAFAFTASLGFQGLYTRALSGAGIDLYGTGFKISNFAGIVVVYLYFQIPLMTIVMLPAIDGLRLALREAAAVHGASARQYWRMVGLPMLAPSFLGGLVLLFANSFAAYATAYALSSGASRLVPVQIRFFLQGETITGKANLGYALATWMIVVTGAAMCVYVMLRRRTERWRG
jgi:putative spermidine/putrescine transport system permease protein